ncbi:hypothetical protein [Nocardia mexicana]|uniref:Uncharacterized protein n=1 Tax=Nocardia mexicana TaxID=279262 RepID=A0A370H3N3_9NOCA|nr:hypothetical protein [Nocardia mexicana]RDI50627.1 hypothetical protein DFR68_105104 [Nocardia mexicana]
MSTDIGTRPSPLRRRPRGWAAPIGAAAIAGLALAVWASTRLQVGPATREAALFVHLVSLVLGMGAVLVADYLALLWLARRTTLAELVRGMRRLHLPIWLGMSGLVASGTFLAPDLAAGATRIKLVLVLALIVNGLQAAALGRRMAAEPAPGRRLLLRGAASALVSQACWWGSVWIGFSTTQS